MQPLSMNKLNLGREIYDHWFESLHSGGGDTTQRIEEGGEQTIQSRRDRDDRRASLFQAPAGVRYTPPGLNLARYVSDRFVVLIILQKMWDVLMTCAYSAQY